MTLIFAPYLAERIESLKTTDASAESLFVSPGAASGELTREINRNLVLDRIRTLQPVSRIDVARVSGLQPSTVSSIVEQLLQEGWIRESALVRTARGRYPTLLTLSDEIVILTADIHARYASVAIVDLHGRFLDRQRVPVCSDPVRSTERIGRAMEYFRERHAALTFEGVGISVPGRVDPTDNRLLMSPNLPWKDYDIRTPLTKRLKLEVQLDNAANACLLSELWFGRVEKIRNAVLIIISEGVGGAILADGRLVTGAQGMAGEFGHICIDLSGPVCGCGARGCWEVFASSKALTRYYKQLSPRNAVPSPLEIVSLALDGDSHARTALERQIEAIGRGLHLLSAIISPDLILFTGDVAFFWDICEPLLQQASRESVMAGEGPVLRCIGDGESERLRGAAAVVLRRHSGYYRSSRRSSQN